MKLYILSLLILCFGCGVYGQKPNDIPIVTVDSLDIMYFSTAATMGFYNNGDEFQLRMEDSSLVIKGDTARVIGFVYHFLDSLINRNSKMTYWLQQGINTGQIQFVRRPQFKFQYLSYQDDSLTTSRFYSDSTGDYMIEYRYVKEGRSPLQEDKKILTAFSKDSLYDYHTHFPATIILIKYFGNKQTILGSCKGIYSEKICAGDNPKLWYRRLKK